MSAHGDTRTITLMTFNVLRDGQHEGGDRRARIAEVVRWHSPDILCMQEGGDDPFWQEMADELGFRHSKNIPGEFRPALFSRLPVLEVATHSEARFVYFQVDLGGARRMGVYSVHLVHWPQMDAERVKALRKLLALMAVQEDPLVCVAGDFNSRTRGEPGIDWGVEAIARHNHTTIGPERWNAATDLMASEGLVDCYRRLNSDPGYSFHRPSEELSQAMPEQGRHARAETPEDLAGVPPVVRLDYIFANPLLTRYLVSCAPDSSRLAMEASDHLPVIAEFVIPDH